ncbi:Probable transmembrane protein [hydrothermal vent metagenome]|uniref:Probable transmembrane protein n=1 Tax=hydrothermal vent metagenome TaxID=652676 RepID=A0A1W1BBN7_9ZZZZ
MKNIMNSIVFAFREILEWHTMKYVLVSGIVISALWIGIGLFFWDFIINISSHILNWVPFSMVRSNGAWMLSAFIWLILILITFAIIFSFFGNFIMRYVSKEKFTSFSIWVALGSTIFWSVVWFFKGDYIYAQFLKLLTWLPFETIEKGVAFLISFYIIYNAIIVSMLFISSLFSEPLIILVEKKHFADDSVVRNNIFSSFGYTIKNTIVFIILSIIAFPLLFIPILNIFIQVALWMWLTKDTVSYNALSLTMENVNKSEIKRNKQAVWFISFVATLFNFVPVLNLFGAYFGEIAMFHYFKTLEQK